MNGLGPEWRNNSASNGTEILLNQIEFAFSQIVQFYHPDKEWVCLYKPK